MKRDIFNKQFADLMKDRYNLTDNHIKAWLAICNHKHLNKGDQFIVADQPSPQIAFNLNGIFRLYYIDKNGNDYTKGFIPENNMVSSYSALIENRGSYFNIEALKDCDVLIFDYDDWKVLMGQDLQWYPLLLSLVEQAYIMKEKREKGFLLDDATTRYLTFRQFYSAIEKDLKQYHIASYLGITPVALSRIRKKLKNMNL